MENKDKQQEFTQFYERQKDKTNSVFRSILTILQKEKKEQAIQALTLQLNNPQEKIIKKTNQQFAVEGKIIFREFLIEYMEKKANGIIQIEANVHEIVDRICNDMTMSYLSQYYLPDKITKVNEKDKSQVNTFKSNLTVEQISTTAYACIGALYDYMRSNDEKNIKKNYIEKISYTQKYLDTNYKHYDSIQLENIDKEYEYQLFLIVFPLIKQIVQPSLIQQALSQKLFPEMTKEVYSEARSKLRSHLETPTKDLENLKNKIFGSEYNIKEQLKSSKKGQGQTVHKYLLQLVHESQDEDKQIVKDKDYTFQPIDRVFEINVKDYGSKEDVRECVINVFINMFKDLPTYPDKGQ